MTLVFAVLMFNQEEWNRWNVFELQPFMRKFWHLFDLLPPIDLLIVVDSWSKLDVYLLWKELALELEKDWLLLMFEYFYRTDVIDLMVCVHFLLGHHKSDWLPLLKTRHFLFDRYCYKGRMELLGSKWWLVWERLPIWYWSVSTLNREAAFQDHRESFLNWGNREDLWRCKQIRNWNSNWRFLRGFNFCHQWRIDHERRKFLSMSEIELKRKQGERGSITSRLLVEPVAFYCIKINVGIQGRKLWFYKFGLRAPVV